MLRISRSVVDRTGQVLLYHPRWRWGWRDVRLADQNEDVYLDAFRDLVRRLG
jgi:hypothetical protein